MGRNQVTALVVPPTLRLGPSIAPSWVSVLNRPEAALGEERMSPERRRFVAERFGYWDSWARDGRPHGYQVGDWE